MNHNVTKRVSSFRLIFLLEYLTNLLDLLIPYKTLSVLPDLIFDLLDLNPMRMLKPSLQNEGLHD